MREFELLQAYVLIAIWATVSVPCAVYIVYELKRNYNEEWLIRRYVREHRIRH